MKNIPYHKHHIYYPSRAVYTLYLIILVCLSVKDSFSDEGDIVWYEARNLTVDGKGWTNTESFYDRLPIYAKNMVRSSVWYLSHDAAGLNVRFKTNADSIYIEWTVTSEDLAMVHMPGTGVSGIDVYGKNEEDNWYFIANGKPTKMTNNIVVHAPAEIQEFIIYLPLYNGVKDLKIGTDRNKFIEKIPIDDQRKQIVFYGTSITQGGCASRPGMAFTSIISRRLNAEIINLGFSGNGRMEPELAKLLAELDPALYVLDCLWNMSEEMVAQRVEPFVSILREYRPKTPILLVEDSNYQNKSTEKGNLLRAIFDKLKGSGDKNLYILANTGMLGDDGDGTVDGVHPNDLGMMRHAGIFIPYLKNLLYKE